jgi:hypothetical protein
MIKFLIITEAKETQTSSTSCCPFSLQLDIVNQLKSIEHMIWVRDSLLLTKIQWFLILPEL